MTIIAILIILGVLGLLFWLLPIKIFIGVLMTLQILDCVLLVTVVLMQRSKSDGLAGGAAFGGGFTEQFFGAGTATVLVKVTTWLGGIFFGLTLLLTVLFSYQSRGITGDGKLKKIVAESKATNTVSGVTNQVSKTTNAANHAGTNATHAGTNATSTNAPAK
jgi:preprotein translocase subunit SecG